MEPFPQFTRAVNEVVFSPARWKDLTAQRMSGRHLRGHRLPRRCKPAQDPQKQSLGRSNDSEKVNDTPKQSLTILEGPQQAHPPTRHVHRVQEPSKNYLSCKQVGKHNPEVEKNQLETDPGGSTTIHMAELAEKDAKNVSYKCVPCVQ